MSNIFKHRNPGKMARPYLEIVREGDSITAMAQPTDAYLKARVTQAFVVNIGQSGQRADNIRINYNTQLKPLINYGKNQTFIVWCGTNDMSGVTFGGINTTRTGAQVYADLLLIRDYLVADGVPAHKIWFPTPCGRNNTGFNASIDSLLTSMRSGELNIVDMYGDIRLRDNANVIIFPDGVHPNTDAGHTAIADNIGRTIYNLPKINYLHKSNFDKPSVAMGSYVPEVGNAWTSQSGTHTVNRMVSSSVSGVLMNTSGGVNGTQEVFWKGSTLNAIYMQYLRFASGNDYIRIEWLLQTTTGTCVIKQTLGGVETIKATISNLALPVSKWHRTKAILNGSSLIVYLENVQIASVTLELLTGTQQGVLQLTTTNTGNVYFYQ